MERERRYVVLKDTDLKAAAAVGLVSLSDLTTLVKISSAMVTYRKMARKAPLDCVVVEADWPEFDATWKSIAERSDGAL